jgi:hypothetical protein
MHTHALHDYYEILCHAPRTYAYNPLSTRTMCVLCARANVCCCCVCVWIIISHADWRASLSNGGRPLASLRPRRGDELDAAELGAAGGAGAEGGGLHCATCDQLELLAGVMAGFEHCRFEEASIYLYYIVTGRSTVACSSDSTAMVQRQHQQQSQQHQQQEPARKAERSACSATTRR